MSSTQLSPSYSYTGYVYGIINDQTLDVQAYDIPLTGLGIYMGNDFSGGSIGSWAGSVVIMTSSIGSSSSPTIIPLSPTIIPLSPTIIPLSPTQSPANPTLDPIEYPTQSPEVPTLSPFVYPSLPTAQLSFTIDLASLGTLSGCTFIQIPFSETGSILKSITFSGVSQSKLCVDFMIGYLIELYICADFNILLKFF